MMKLQTRYSISQEDMNMLLQLVKQVTGDSATKFPISTKELEEITKDLVIPHEEHLICPCGKTSFQPEQSNICQYCKTSKDDAVKFYYIPLERRLKELYEIESVAKTMKTREIPSSNVVSDLHQSRMWSEFTSSIPDNRTLALSYCSDGFNPFHHHITQGTYSVWGMSGAILNLPPDMRSKASNLLVYGLVSGPKTPAKLTLCNRVLIDELVRLRDGVPAYDADSKETFSLVARLEMMVFDVPGSAKEQNRMQHGSIHACTHCEIEGEHSKVLDKVVYLGSRKFLPIANPLRNLTSFPSGTVEKDVVKLRSAEEERNLGRHMAEVAQLGNTLKSLANLPTAIAKDTGRLGDCEWFRLDLDMQQRHTPVDPMHCLKVVGEHVVKLVNGTDDTQKLRAEERRRGRFVESCPDSVFRIYSENKQAMGPSRAKKKKNNTNESSAVNETDPTVELSSVAKSSMPPAPFSLTAEEKTKADERLKNLRVPVGFGDLPEYLFRGTKGGMKTHTWILIFTQGIFRYCLRDCLGEVQRTTLLRFCLLLEFVFANSVKMDRIDELEEEWHFVLSLMELNFPVALKGYVMHLLHHLIHYIKWFGPVRNFWMFMYERENKEISESISNNRYPELSAIKHYKMKWLLNCLELSGMVQVPTSSTTSKPLPKYLSGFTKERKPTAEEVKVFGPVVSVKEYSHAKKKEEPASKPATYRSSKFEEKLNSRESSKIVYVRFGSDLVVGEVMYFVSAKNQEVAYIQWIGLATRSPKTLLYFVDKTCGFYRENEFVDVKSLSLPLIYSWEGDILWLPKFP